MLKNQLKVLLQRVYNGGRTPKNIILSPGLREALRAEMQGSAKYTVGTFPKEDTFFGITVVVAKDAHEPMVQLEPTSETLRESKGLIIPDKRKY